jgi:hypothetical protein
MVFVEATLVIGAFAVLSAVFVAYCVYRKRARRSQYVAL